MLDTVVHVLKVHPDDLRGNRAEAPRMEPEDRTVYDPRCARLEAAGSALYTGPGHDERHRPMWMRG